MSHQKECFFFRLSPSAEMKMVLNWNTPRKGLLLILSSNQLPAAELNASDSHSDHLILQNRKHTLILN